MNRDSVLRLKNDTVSFQWKSDAALFSRALRDNRLPKPKILSFDGDPKQFRMFMASFQSNVEEMLDDGDEKMKLTLLLQHCSGKALALIDDCVMLPPQDGYCKAIKKLEKRFGKTHKIAQSYIEDVVKGAKLKLNDVDGLVQLTDDMEKCQTVLSQLKFASDLDSTGTLRSIVERLPDYFQTQWVKRSCKILDRGVEPTLRYLTTFIEERANEYSSKCSQFYAESHEVKSKPADYGGNQHQDKKSRFTTMATSVGGPGASTAGPDVKPKCLHCVREGQVIWRCFKFKGLSVDRRKEVTNKLNLCHRCLKEDHDSTSCKRRCATCDGDHSTLLHDKTETQESSDTGEE